MADGRPPIPPRPDSRSAKREAAMRELRQWGESQDIPSPTNERSNGGAEGQQKTDAYILQMIDSPDSNGPPKPLPGKFIFSFDKPEEQSKPKDEKPLLYKDQQLVHNFALTSYLMESCESNDQFHGELVTKAQNERSQLLTRSSSLAEGVTKYNNEMEWVEKSDFTAEHLIEKYGLTLKREEVSMDDNELSTVPSALALKAILSELLEKTRARSLMERGKFHTELRKALLGLGVDASENILDFADAATADVLVVIKDELAKKEPKIKEVERRILNTITAKKEALSREDMQATNQFHLEIIEQHEKLLDMTLARVQQIKLADSDPDSFARKFMELHAPAMHLMEEFATRRKARAKVLYHDIECLEGLEKIAEDKHRAAELDFREWRQAAVIEMGETSKQQDALFSDIVVKYKELMELGEKKSKQVLDYIKKTEGEERRKTAHTKFLQVCPEYRAQLNLNIRLIESQLSCLDEIDDYFKKCDAIVKENVKKFSAELDAMMVKEMHKYFETFRKHHLTSGELLFKKEQRLHALNRQIRSTKLQLQTSIDTLDENVKDYREQLRALQERKATMAKQMEELTRRIDTVVAAFAPIAEEFKARGIEYLHPVIELQEMNVDRKQKILEVAQKAVQMEQTAVDTQNVSLRKLTSSTKVAKETKEARMLAEHTQMAALAIAARPSSGPGFSGGPIIPT
eukprot:TRINITY_DN57784_c0_g1_i1.p1 TRINITY_DN57784_c0_g1~~TRINITY_DN57784_c0_g1_i1.p1  ORF type:complete len:689 (-),score=65.07 TRINITY_DN57784_c0_g1_i1:159-2225(-)